MFLSALTIPADPISNSRPFFKNPNISLAEATFFMNFSIALSAFTMPAVSVSKSKTVVSLSIIVLAIKFLKVSKRALVAYYSTVTPTALVPSFGKSMGKLYI